LYRKVVFASLRGRQPFGLRVVVAAFAADFEKRGAPYGAGWDRLTAAGCIEGLYSLTLKGKVAASPQYLASFHRKEVSP
jgi:hypothetical protein